MNSNLVHDVEKFIYEYFKKNKTKDLVYHDILHTTDVVKAAEKIGLGTNLNSEEMEILLISAWFHDTGYTIDREDHESASAEIASSYLNMNNYPPTKIEKVKSCILSTKLPQNPKNNVEEVLCDADLQHLAKKNFIERSEWLKVEEEKVTGNLISEIDWFNNSLNFISNHNFFTHYAKEKYSERKRENIVKLQKRIKKTELSEKTDRLKEEKLIFEKEKLKEKKANSGKADRGIETMFRNVIRTHVEFSSMADSKANIMISVNTLILTAIVAILSRKLDNNQHLIIPTIILTLVSLTTLVYAILVTRPKITSGLFTEEDIKKKKANLLFFGNFYKMKLDKFTWGMQEMMNDKEYLYGSMIKDFYFLGQVLGVKYKNLNICYNVFMIGIIVSIFAFTVAVVLHPGATEMGLIID
jgi:predicted metal-dependent HD superfamily phosphohydrolase